MANQATPSDEVLTLHEGAQFVKVSEKTLWAEAKAGRVPHFKLGKQYRFVRSELLEWARSSGSPSKAR
jgi:excisionase family DNA binding protein